ncbi:hypothetical protein D910_07016 [Dendroctonus ponderosae]
MKFDTKSLLEISETVTTNGGAARETVATEATVDTCQTCLFIGVDDIYNIKQYVHTFRSVERGEQDRTELPRPVALRGISSRVAIRGQCHLEPRNESLPSGGAAALHQVPISRGFEPGPRPWGADLLRAEPCDCHVGRGRASVAAPPSAGGRRRRPLGQRHLGTRSLSARPSPLLCAPDHRKPLVH